MEKVFTDADPEFETDLNFSRPRSPMDPSLFMIRENEIRNPSNRIADDYSTT